MNSDTPVRLQSDGALFTGGGFLADGRIVTAQANGVLQIWNPQDGAELIALQREGPAVVRFASAKCDHRWLATGFANGEIALWDLRSGDMAFRRAIGGDKQAVHHLALSPDGQRAIAACGFENAKIVAIPSGDLIADLNSGLTSCVATTDHSALVGSSDGNLRIWSIGNGALRISDRAHSEHMSEIALSPDGGHAVTTAQDGLSQVWRIETGERIGPPAISKSGAWNYCAAFSPDGLRYAIGDSNGWISIYTFDSRGLVILDDQHVGHILSLEFTPSGRELLSTAMDGMVHLWSIENERSVHDFDLVEEPDDAAAAQLSPDGKFALVVSWDGEATLWPLAPYLS